MSVKFVHYKSKLFPNGVVGIADGAGKSLQALAGPSGAPITSLYDLIESWDTISTQLLPVGGVSEEDIDSVQVLPPLPGRDVLAVGKNYKDHAKEFQQSGFDSSDKNEQPDFPVIFTKRASSIIPHNTPVYPHPMVTDTLDYEGELGVIIGKGGINIKKEDAWKHVWGAVVLNDVTARERQRDHKQFFIGKSLDTFCPMGAYAVHASSLDWNNMMLETKINGQVRQSQNTKDLIFDIPTLIETISMGITLMPGDLIATGTPAGVGIGKTPPVYLKPGDVMEVSITGLGTLKNVIASADEQAPPCEPVRAKSSVLASASFGGDDIVTLASGQVLHAEDSGTSGSPVVFIHGLGGSATAFYPLIKTLSLESRHRVINFDWEGHGLSLLTGLSLTVESLARSVADVLAAYKVQKATIVAHSFGGLIATHFAASYPDLVDKLVLIGPVKKLGPPGVSAMTDRAALVRNKGMAAVVPAILTNGLSEQTRKSNVLAQALVKSSLLSTKPEGYAQACLALAGAEDPDYAKIVAPTLIVAGDQDKTSPQATTDALTGAITGSKAITLASVGHWHFLEDVEGVAKAISSFL